MLGATGEGWLPTVRAGPGCDSNLPRHVEQSSLAVRTYQAGSNCLVAVVEHHNRGVRSEQDHVANCEPSLISLRDIVREGYGREQKGEEQREIDDVEAAITPLKLCALPNELFLSHLRLSCGA